MQPTETPERTELVEYYVSKGSVPSVPRSTALELAKPSRALAILNVLRRTAISNLALSLIVLVAHLTLAIPWANLAAVTIIFSSRGQDSQVFQVPGPSLALYNAQTYYTCSTNRYVSTSGLNTNNGTQPTQGAGANGPWDIVTASTQSLSAGTCVNVAVGNYTSAMSINNGISLASGGTSASKTGHVVWRCAVLSTQFINGVISGEGNGCVLGNTNTSGPVAAVYIPNGTNYIMLDGFEINCGTQSTNGTGYGAQDGGNVGFGMPNLTTKYHHLWLLNNDIHNCGGGGVQIASTDWLFFIHNSIHDTSTFNTADESGISIFQPAGLTGYTPTVGNTDYWHSNTTGRTYRMVYSYNALYHNYNNFSGSTDGEGIILDTWAWGGACNVGTSGATCPYDGNTLIMGNAAWGNGGNGIEVVFSKGPPDATGHIDIINNTAYSNAWTNNMVQDGNFLSNQGLLITAFNNISISVSNTRDCFNPATGGITTGCTVTDIVGANNNTWQTNLTYPGSLINFDTGNSYPLTGANKNVDGTNPNLTMLNAITSVGGSGAENFSLQPGSAAIGFGQAFDLWQQSGSVDAGACVHQVTSCP